MAVILVQPGHGLEGGSSSGVTLANGVSRRSVAVGGVGDWDEGSVTVSEISWLGISAPLAKSLGAPGHEGGGSSGVGSDSGQTVSVAVRVSIGSVVVGTVQVGG